MAIAGFTLLLSWVGPTIDAEPYGPPPPPSHELRAEAARLEAEARARCDALAGRNSGWIQLADGQIACTDKRGRRHRSAITTLERRQP